MYMFDQEQFSVKVTVFNCQIGICCQRTIFLSFNINFIIKGKSKRTDTGCYSKHLLLFSLSGMALAVCTMLKYSLILLSKHGTV